MPNSVARLVGDPSENARLQKALEADPYPEDLDSPVFFPGFVRAMPPQERQAFFQDVKEFTSLMPRDTEKDEDILTWLGSYPAHKRTDLYQFLVGEKKGPDGKFLGLPADARERADMLEYMDVWNSDPRQAPEKGTSVWSMWFHITDGTTMWAVHAAVLVVFL